MTEPDAPAPTPARPSRARRLVEWFTRSRALADARAFRTKLPPRERQALERSLRAQELAERAYDPVDALRSGSSTSLSVSLYREAAYWALLREESTAETLAGMVDATPRPQLEQLAGGPEQLGPALEALVDRSFVQTAALPEALLAADALAARSFVNEVLRQRLLPEQRTGRLKLQRAVRSLALAGLVLAGGLSAWSYVKHARLGPDLAEGRPWRASSSYAVCRPAEHRCAGTTTKMFFHTEEEKNPWLEIDLGKPQSFNRVDVTNRDDCCPDRAVPLVIEASADAKSWKQLARQDRTFTVWEAEFAPETARYVRLRVPRRSILHLSKVSVRHAR